MLRLFEFKFKLTIFLNGNSRSRKPDDTVGVFKKTQKKNPNKTFNKVDKRFICAQCRFYFICKCWNFHIVYLCISVWTRFSHSQHLMYICVNCESHFIRFVDFPIKRTTVNGGNFAYVLHYKHTTFAMVQIFVWSIKIEYNSMPINKAQCQFISLVFNFRRILPFSSEFDTLSQSQSLKLNHQLTLKIKLQHFYMRLMSNGKIKTERLKTDW